MHSQNSDSQQTDLPSTVAPPFVVTLSPILPQMLDFAWLAGAIEVRAPGTIRQSKPVLASPP